MTTETETFRIDPQALRFARDQMRISQRELGRRVASRLGREDATRALQVRLGRIERGDEVSEQERELLEALAAELAIGVDELEQAPVWAWIRVLGGRPGIVELAMRFPVYTSPDVAFRARDFLAHASNGHFKPFQDAQLVPMRPLALSKDVLDENYPDLDERDRSLLIAVDPDEDTLPYLAALNEVMNAQAPEGSMDAIVDTIDKFGLVGEIVQLYKLALRRLPHAPDDPAIVTAWARREFQLNRLLELLEQHRLELREQTMAGIVAGEVASR